jgi:UDP-2,3-diacylglucosamine hydrolase
MIGFIADVHLSPRYPHTTRWFLEWLNYAQTQLSELYILGDWFDLWHNDAMDLVHYRDMLAAVTSMIATGVQVYFLPGNRDFMIGERFAKATGVILLSDPHVLVYQGTRIVLTHGDLLCTDDHAYQKMRSILQHPITKWTFNHIPSFIQRGLARLIRNQSNTNKQHKPHQIMDVNVHAVEQMLARHDADRIIHGHVHRPGLRRNNTRMVVGEWQHHPVVGLLDQTGMRLVRWPGLGVFP